MRIWLFKDGESLPVETNSRRMRTGMLAEELRRQGHEVHWFSSTFMHLPKRVYASHDIQCDVAPGLTLHLVHAGGFQRNLSLERYRFHRRYARRLSVYCGQLAAPDVLVCSFPLIDVADWAVRYARAAGIPAIIDVRDLWPDTIVGLFPAWARPLVRAGLAQDYRRTGALMRGATSITAMSQGVLRWALGYAERTAQPCDRVFPIGFPQSTADDALPALTPRLESWLPALASKRLFTYVGTFGHTYDLRGILSAARLLVATGDAEPHFVLAGAGPLLQEIRGASRDLPNVTVPGWLEQADIRALLGRSFAGLLPWAGLDDAMPNKFFEYISAGLPVVSSARGELNDLITQERIGFNVPVGDGEALAAVARGLCGDPAAQDGMARRAGTVFTTKFREELVYRDFASFVTELVTTSHSALKFVSRATGTASSMAPPVMQTIENASAQAKSYHHE